jgi:hypothetical protein
MGSGVRGNPRITIRNIRLREIKMHALSMMGPHSIDDFPRSRSVLTRRLLESGTSQQVVGLGCNSLSSASQPNEASMLTNVGSI